MNIDGDAAEGMDSPTTEPAPGRSGAAPTRQDCDAGAECEGRPATALKHAPFYGDVYGPAFFGPLISFNSFHGVPCLEGTPEGVSVMTAPFFAPRRSFCQSVPTEETSLLGRRRKQKRKDAPATANPYQYMSAVCGGELDPFCFRPMDRIPAVYAAPTSGEVADILQQFLNEDFCSVGKASPESAETAEKTTPTSKQSPTDSRPEAAATSADEVKDCIAAFAPQMKRKRVSRDGACRRKKNQTVPEGRSSRFRGVTKHRRSGRWEAHIWIKEMGRQVYLGGYEKEEHAAEAYDVAAIKSKGDRVKTNFDVGRYADLRAAMDSTTMEELVMIVRRQSQGFSRGTSVFRGVTHHPSGRWEARIGIPGSKHIYLGLYDDEFEAARWYDRALVRLRGPAAATNFLLSSYQDELAEFNELQQAVLQSGEAERAEVPEARASFENWVKFGRRGATGGCEGGGGREDEDAQLREKKHRVSQLVMRALGAEPSEGLPNCGPR